MPASQRVFATPIPDNEGHLTVTSGKMYAIYLRHFLYPTPSPFKFIRGRLHTSTGGTGTQAAEVAFMSSPLGPCKAGQTLTWLAGSATLDSLTQAGALMVGNTSAMSYTALGHLWATMRVAMSGVQPTFDCTAEDFGQGWSLVLAASGVLQAGTYAGGLPPYMGTTGTNVDLIASYD